MDHSVLLVPPCVDTGGTTRRHVPPLLPPASFPSLQYYIPCPLPPPPQYYFRQSSVVIKLMQLTAVSATEGDG